MEREIDHRHGESNREIMERWLDYRVDYRIWRRTTPIVTLYDIYSQMEPDWKRDDSEGA